MFHARRRIFKTSVNKQIDITKPTVVISSTESSPTNSNPIPVTFTWSEPVIGFTVGDLELSNCTAANFTMVSPDVYTVNLTPTDSDVYVDVPAGICKDISGNLNLAASTFQITAIITLLRDTFTASDGTALVGRMPDVGGVQWSGRKINSDYPNDGTNDIQTNRARLSYNTDWDSIYFDLVDADFICDVSWYCTTEARIAIIFRATTASGQRGNYYKIQLRQNYSDWYIKKCTDYAEVWTAASGSQTWSPGTTYTIRVRMQGNEVKLYFDNNLKATIDISVSTPIYTATIFALGCHMGNEGFIDEVTVSKIY